MTTKHTFYVEPASIQGEVVAFPAAESNHATRVLRLGVGDLVTVVDGCGRRMHAKLMELSRKRVLAVVQQEWREVPVLPGTVIVAAALLKSANRYETMLEKVAEVGATKVVPLITDRTEKSKFRPDRAQTILVSAMKQSGSSFLTELGPLEKISGLLNGLEPEGTKLICHEGVDPSVTLASVFKGRDKDEHVTLLIGPEGGFADREMEMAGQAGFIPVSLGRARLRAETAAIIAVGGISQLKMQN